MFYYFILYSVLRSSVQFSIELCNICCIFSSYLLSSPYHLPALLFPLLLLFSSLFRSSSPLFFSLLFHRFLFLVLLRLLPLNLFLSFLLSLFTLILPLFSLLLSLCPLLGEKESGAVRTEMQGPLRALQTSARNIAKIFIDAKLECDEEEYVKSFNSGEIY